MKSVPCSSSSSLSNPRMSCKSALIPHLDLTPWIEAPAGIGPEPYPPATQIEVSSNDNWLNFKFLSSSGPYPFFSTSPHLLSLLHSVSLLDLSLI